MRVPHFAEFTPLSPTGWTGVNEDTNLYRMVRLDTLSPKERSERMSRVRGRDTKPEMKVRRLIHGMGYRYRLHAKDLPGTPDIVFRKHQKAIFVHGCFWHRHKDCKLARLPKSRTDFWIPKLEGNRRRDEINQKMLGYKGWQFIIVWECELKDAQSLIRKIRAFLD